MEKFSELKEKLRIVIFCGGYGTRMWPMSRQNMAKQFQPLIGERSFFQEALKRIKLEFKPEDIFISTPEEQIKSVLPQAKEIPSENIIAEPERRDTLGAVGYTTVFIDKYFPNSLVAIIWGADHIIREEKRFARLLKIAASVCQAKDVICKICVKPPYMARTFGWLKVGKLVGKVSGCHVYEFEKHIEKPDPEIAKKFFSNKRYLVHTGYFVYRTSLMLEFFKKYSSSTYNQLIKIKELLGEKNKKGILKKEYHKIEKTSVDFGIFEKLPPGSQLVIPADLGWYDVGTWDLLYEALARGQRENVIKGEVEFIDAKGNLVYMPKGKIAGIVGLDNLLVVDTKDGLLVCKRGRGEEVKKLVEILKQKGKTGYL